MLSHRSARKNMVDGQLSTNGILNQSIIQLFSVLPREIFVPDEYKSRAYVDEDVVLSNGQVLMEPLVHARLLQAADPHADDVALIVGDQTGYAAAMLSALVSLVFVTESRPGLLSNAANLWGEMGANNLAVISGYDANGCPEHAPYNVIILHGAVPFVPANLLDQLAPWGRLLTVLRQPDDHVGRITMIMRDDNNNFAMTTLQDASTPYIPTMMPPLLFKFGT
jgi:protein-L-isoaspartate(D-aspartate) O-methyltransferase